MSTTRKISTSAESAETPAYDFDSWTDEAEEKAIAARLMEKMVLPGFVSGDLSVPVTDTFPLADAPKAYERFQAGGKLGKIVLNM